MSSFSHELREHMSADNSTLPSGPDWQPSATEPFFTLIQQLCPAADANILINTCRLAAQRYLFAYQEPIPVEQLVKTLCDNKQVSLATFVLLHRF